MGAAAAVSVRHRAVPLSPGEARELERVILEALSPAARAAHAVVLAELGLAPDAPWFAVPTIRRLFEQLAWRQLTAWAEARGLTRWPAEQWAAQQLGRPVRTFQTRLPVAGKNPEATVHVTRTVECLA